MKKRLDGLRTNLDSRKARNHSVVHPAASGILFLQDNGQIIVLPRLLCLSVPLAAM